MRLKIVGLEFGGDLAFEALPGIAGTLDQLYGFVHAVSSMRDIWGLSDHPITRF
jgi:hypothetical protein